MYPEVSCSGELEKVIAPKGTIEAAHDTESLYRVSAQLPITQRIEIKRWRSRRHNQRRLDKITNEGADGRREVNVAVTGRSKRELAIEESQPSTIGEANQRKRRRKTGSVYVIADLDVSSIAIMLSVLGILSYAIYFLYGAAAFLCMAIGLFYLSEIVEEYTVATGKVQSRDLSHVYVAARGPHRRLILAETSSHVWDTI
nr:unnamed protein product [Spirometra erinaceieuropaei]